jgi:hypothetical protein
MRQPAFLAAALFCALSLYHPAAAENAATPAAASAAQPTAQTSSGGVTILRGSVPPRPVPFPPLPLPPYGSSYPPPTAPSPGLGWDAGGFDRDFDWSGTDPAFAPVR